MDTLIIARHAHAESNEQSTTSSEPPGAGLTTHGSRQAELLGALVAGLEIEVGVASQLARTQQTLRLALPDAPVLVFPAFNEIRYGHFEGRPLAEYLEWAWSAGPHIACPGGGESRADAAARIAAGLRLILERPERTAFAVLHAMAIHYINEASEGRVPPQRVPAVPHAQPTTLTRGAVEQAARTLDLWARAPSFADPSNGARSSRE